MVAWWPGDGTPNDIVGTTPGILQGGAMFGTGMVAQAFALDRVNDYGEVDEVEWASQPVLTTGGP
jgi:hypothetical protein